LRRLERGKGIFEGVCDGIGGGWDGGGAWGGKGFLELLAGVDVYLYLEFGVWSWEILNETSPANLSMALFLMFNISWILAH